MLDTIRDRTKPIENVVRELLDYWKYDLYTRKPGPAYFEDGQLTMTDLDLACFMSALADRNAVITIPHYTSRRPKTEREGERVVSDTNRHGQIIGLTANKDVFSFSVMVRDFNVVQSGEVTASGRDEVGAPRNFMLTDLNGEWWSGWDRIEFDPSAKENAFLNDKKLWTGNTIYFKNFVHPNRWVSMYGEPYFLTKALIQRLEEETSFVRAELKRLAVAGTFESVAPAGEHYHHERKEERESGVVEKVNAFQAEVDVPMIGEYTPLTEATARARQDWLKNHQYGALPQLRFASRASELAFYKYGITSKIPTWVKTAAWEEGYVEAGKRTKWVRMARPGNGLELAVRYRVWEKTERVAD